MTSPTAAVSPCFLSTSVMMPAAGAGNSMEAFSLSRTTTGSSRWTESPFCLSQLPISTSETDSPAAGILSSIGIVSSGDELSLFGLMAFARTGGGTRGGGPRNHTEWTAKNLFAKLNPQEAPRAHVLRFFLHPGDRHVRRIAGQSVFKFRFAQWIQLFKPQNGDIFALFFQ